MKRRFEPGPFKRVLLLLKQVCCLVSLFSCYKFTSALTHASIAGAIHGDFERGFIKAEVVAYQDFHDLCEGNKSMAPIKAAGKFRQEGKTYLVQDGDIIHFQFSNYYSPFQCIQILNIIPDANSARCCTQKVNFVWTSTKEVII